MSSNHNQENDSKKALLKAMSLVNLFNDSVRSCITYQGILSHIKKCSHLNKPPSAIGQFHSLNKYMNMH